VAGCFGCTVECRAPHLTFSCDRQKAIEFDPKLAMAYNNRGSAYGKNGDLDRAIADVKKAIELDPKLMLLVPGIILAQSLFYAVVVFVVARKRKINPWGWTIAALVPFIGFVVAAVFFLVTLLSILDHLNRLEARTGNMGQGLQSIRDTEKT
jgi:tetratricopeptide (TPR) repeat protein